MWQAIAVPRREQLYRLPHGLLCRRAPQARQRTVRRLRWPEQTTRSVQDVRGSRADGWVRGIEYVTIPDVRSRAHIRQHMSNITYLSLGVNDSEKYFR